MDDVLAALKAEVNQSDDTEHGLLATDDTDTSTRNVDFATTTTSSGEDHDAHDDNDILVHMQSLDDSGHSLSSTAPPPRDVSPCTFAGAAATEMDIDHHIDTIEEVVVHDTIDVEVISTVTALYSPAKAVLSTPVEPNEQDEMFHDQEVTRVLTTLESAKEREVASSPQEGAVVDETTAEMAEYMESVISNEDDAALLDTSGVSEKSNAEDVQELARRQLANMSSTKKRGSAKASNVIRNMKSRLAHRIETNNTPNNHKTNIKFESHGGTIEIPKELILGSEELHSSVLLSSGTPLKNEDLLAILEGSDDEVNGDAKVRAIPGCLDKEMEKKLALQQMISLPSMPKGRRPKPKTVVEEKATKKPTAKKAKTNELVNSLVMDWSGGSDSESKSEEVEVAPQKKLKPLPKKLPVVGAKADAMAVAPITFKRSRIIKKKIIWDPDAPETAVSYASLIQPSAAFIKKTQSNAVAVKSTTSGDNPPPRILNKIPAQIQQQEEKELLLAAKKRNLATPSPNALKKRKISELDRLLGDEGAVNMLNALKQETNLTDSSDKETTPDSSITVADRRRKTTAAAGSTSPAVEEKYNPRQPRIKQQPQTPQANAQQPKKDGAAAIKRKKAAVAAASNSWDYIYSKRDEEALIIRRRSNSSYSSSASNNRLSIDGPTPPAFAKSAKAASTAKSVRPRTRETATTFEFAKPNARKSVPTTDEVESTILMDIRPKVASPKSGTTPSSSVHSRRQAVARATSSSATSDDGSESSVSVEYKPTPKEKKPVVAAKLDAPARPTVTSKSSAKSKAVYQEIRLDRDNGVAHIELAPFSDKLENVFTLQMMREVCKALFVLDDDATCKVVLISSATATFCNGLDYSTLVQTTAEKRRLAAAELASEVGKFIESLASFRKTLIADIHGHIVGLGVTILPLFDLVLANANSTFETPYSRLGQIPEACSVFLLSNKISNNAKIELLQLGETLDAASAHGHSMVTKVIHSNGFEAELQRQVNLVAKASVQSLEAAKALIHTAELAALPVRLAEEQKVLQQHWLSTECQQTIKQLLATKQW